MAQTKYRLPVNRHFDNLDYKVIFFCYRNIINSKCHTLVYEFLCQILQPVCYLDKIVLPCREFCNEFLEQCVSEMEGFENLKKLINCDNYLTESDGPGACISKPGCVAELRNSGKNSVICDGVVDCPVQII